MYEKKIKKLFHGLPNRQLFEDTNNPVLTQLMIRLCIASQL